MFGTMHKKSGSILLLPPFFYYRSYFNIKSLTSTMMKSRYVWFNGKYYFFGVSVFRKLQYMQSRTRELRRASQARNAV